MTEVDYQRRYVERLRSRCMAYYGGRCVKCGGHDGLEFAHLQPTKLSGRGRGSKHRLLDVQRNLNKYTLLCKTCHIEFDNGGHNESSLSPQPAYDAGRT